MFGLNLEVLRDLGLTGWPLVTAITVICMTTYAIWHGEWPWSGIIQKNYNCDCTCKSCAGEDENKD